MRTSAPRRGATIKPHPALRDYIQLVTISVTSLEASAQQLKPYQPPVVMGFSGITVS